MQGNNSTCIAAYLIFHLHCSAVQVHCSTMPFPPWFKSFISSSIGGSTQFLFEKVVNFMKYTGIEIYHTFTFLYTFENHFLYLHFVFLLLPLVEKLKPCMLP